MHLPAKFRIWFGFGLIILFAIGFTGLHGQPPGRTHRITQKGTLRLEPADVQNAIENAVEIRVQDGRRIIEANGIPKHMTGKFPNRGNPNSMTSQTHRYAVAAEPQMADRITPIRGEFGVGVNGIPFDPGAGEFYAGDRRWQYEPLSGAISLGLDGSHGHVQPTGKYHYHGLPTGLLKAMPFDSERHSPLVGWAADGFPIYAIFGYQDPLDASSDIAEMTSSYRLRTGNRPGGNAPDGVYDGTFVRDYEFVEGSGTLDRCNGRFCKTPEFPDGTYAYFLTNQWPVVPRNFRGTPSSDFMHGPAGGRGLAQRGMGPSRDRQSAGGREAFGPPGAGRSMFPAPPPPGTVLPSFLQDELDLSDAQAARLDQLQNDVDRRLREILTPEQFERLQQPPRGRSPGRIGGPAGRDGRSQFGSGERRRPPLD